MAFLRPDTDSVDGNWTNQVGNNTNLFDSVNESMADDADYIQSPASPVNEVCKIGLSDPAGSLSEPFVLRYRFNNSAGVELTVRLMQGTTEIASWLETATGWTTQTRTLSTAQFNAMGGVYTDLYVELKANVAGPPSFAAIFGADLIAWYDASDAASITHASGAVSQWNDKSGNAYHLVQATGANRPIYSVTGLGGSQPSIAFGDGQWLQTATNAIATSSTTGFAAFAVARMNSGADNFARLVSFTGNGSTADWNNDGSASFINRTAATQAIETDRSNVFLSAKNIIYDATFRAASVFGSNTHTMYLENVAGTPVSFTDRALTATGTLAVGTQAIGGTAHWTGGHICEVAFVKVAPSAGQLSSVQAMLAAKWTA